MEITSIINSTVCLVGIMFIISIMFLGPAIRVVPENRRLVIHRLGRYIGKRGPGLIFLIPLLDRGVSIDINDEVTKAQAYRNMFGAIGETKTSVHNEGQVVFDGEVWSATSAVPIPPGTRVRLIKVVYEVEAI